MIRSTFQSYKAFRPVYWLSAGLLLVCIGLTGCNSLDFRKDKLQYDPALNAGKMRPPRAEGDFFGVSNKARQIEGRL